MSSAVSRSGAAGSIGSSSPARSGSWRSTEARSSRSTGSSSIVRSVCARFATASRTEAVLGSLATISAAAMMRASTRNGLWRMGAGTFDSLHERVSRNSLLAARVCGKSHVQGRGRGVRRIAGFPAQGQRLLGERERKVEVRHLDGEIRAICPRHRNSVLVAELPAKCFDLRHELGRARVVAADECDVRKRSDSVHLELSLSSTSSDRGAFDGEALRNVEIPVNASENSCRTKPQSNVVRRRVVSAPAMRLPTTVVPHCGALAATRTSTGRMRAEAGAASRRRRLARP